MAQHDPRQNGFNNIFGFLNLQKAEETSEPDLPAIVAPENIDAATDIEVEQHSGSHAIYGFNFVPEIKDTKNQIDLYRKTARIPEVRRGVEEIVNQAIVPRTDAESIVELDLEKTDFSDGIKKKIQKEFETILQLYNFNYRAEDMFNDWYVDSRIAYHKMYDSSSKAKQTEGIKELRRLDVRYLEKIRIINKKTLASGHEVILGTKEYYKYKPEDQDTRYTTVMRGGEVQIPVEAVVFAHSHLYDECRKNIISYIHDAIKPANSLKMLEDAAVIYRLARAPERRVFYVDVGNMPKTKAEQYIKNIMNRFKNKIVYDSTTGSIKNKYDTQSILEDYWLPRREGSKGTQVETLPGGASLGQIEELQYFKKNLYESLRVPFSRFDNENQGTFDLGKPTEVTRDELRFARLVTKLQKLFSAVFDDVLKTQVLLKNIITADEWEANKNNVVYTFNTDTYYEEIKENEILQGRVDLANSLQDFVGKYFSHDDVQRDEFKFSDEQIETKKKQINEEKKDERFREDDGF